MTETIFDVAGGAWQLPPFTLGLLNRIKRETGVDFLMEEKRGKDVMQDAENWFTMLYDPARLGAVLYVIFEKEKEKRNLSDDQFAELLGGEMLEGCRKAIVTELVSFIHSPQVATAMKAEMPQIMARIETALIARWKSTVGGWLESLESTPIPSV